MNILQKFNLIIVLLCFISIPACAVDLDCTVDDAIRKNYNVDAINNIKSTNQSTTKSKTNTSSMSKLPATSNASQVVTKNTVQTSVKGSFPLRKGMCFDIKNTNAISDRQYPGTNIVFINPKPIRTAYYTIPEGTKFIGKIVKTHSPQLSGNGGLVTITICNLVLSGRYQKISAEITKVGDKHVYFENIKGKRTYISNTVQKGKWGRSTFHKMNKLSGSLLKDPPTIILAPFTFTCGVLAAGTSMITSPVVAIFTKGGRVYLPQGTMFRIKLNSDVKLYY